MVVNNHVVYSFEIYYFCRVIECSDLPVTNGSCNPYAVVTVNYGKIKNREEVKRTNVKKKTICPQFEETFFFDVSINIFFCLFQCCPLWLFSQPEHV